MKKKHCSFHQAILIIVLIITYSSFSDYSYTITSPAGSSDMHFNPNALPNSGPYVFYSHLPSMPLEEDYANMLYKVPYRLFTYRLGNATGILHTFLTSTFSIAIVLAVLFFRLPKTDKPRLYSLLPFGGHGPPEDGLIFSLS